MSRTRVVLYGRPLAGKTTIIEALGRARGSELRGIRLATEYASFDLPSHHGVITEFALGATRCEVATIPGEVLGDGPWRTLLDGAQAVVVVLDCQAGADAQNEVLRSLDLLPRTWNRGCVVLSKADLVPQNIVETTRSYVEGKLKSRRLELPVFIARVDQPETLEKPMDWLLSRL